jgi:SagB-type dehydrogenase family enzyme
MAIRKGKSTAVAIPDSSPHADQAITLEPVLLQELEELEYQEQQVLCGFLKRAKRHRSVSGQIDELTIVVNGLKEYTTEEEWLPFQKLNEKIAPDLHKEFVDSETIQLETKFAPIAKPISEVISSRTSIRDFKRTVLSCEKLSALLNHSCGVRGTVSAYNRRDIALRNFPTPGGLQCTEFYLVANEIEGVSQGLYHYSSKKNCLELLEKGNFRWRVADCCPQHEWLAEASVVIFIASDTSRLTWKYGSYRSYRLAHLETGIVSQNLHLVATALELGSCMVFGFDDERTDSLLGLDGLQEFTVLLVAVGNKIDKKSLLKKFTNRNS